MILIHISPTTQNWLGSKWNRFKLTYEILKLPKVYTINKPKGPAIGDHSSRWYFTPYPKRTKFDITNILPNSLTNVFFIIWLEVITYMYKLGPNQEPKYSKWLMRKISKDIVFLTIKSNIPTPNQEPKRSKSISHIVLILKWRWSLLETFPTFIPNCNHNYNF